MSIVPSVLRESTTMISSAQETEASAAAIWERSLCVMTVTVSFVTGRQCTSRVRKTKRSRQPRGLPAPVAFPERETDACLPRRRRDLNRLEPDDRPVVIDHRVDLILPLPREVALGLDQLERGGHADGHPLLLRGEPLLGAVAGLARGFDA